MDKSGNLDISVLGLLKSVLYENKTTDIKLMAYKVELLHPTQPIVLQEHLQYMWVTKQELNNYNLCAADEKLVKILF